MALTSQNRWALNLTLQDNNGKKATFGLNFAGDLTPAEMDSNVTALAATLADVSDAAIVGASYSRVFVESAPIAPAASSEVERKLVIPLGTAAALPGITSVEVPSPVFSLETANTDVVVPEVGSALADLVLFLTAGLASPGNGPVTHYGADITRVGVMTVSHRRRAARK